jgi:hypothetical protein
MKEKWQSLTTIQKVLTSIAASIAAIAAIGGTIYTGYDHFATKSYADAGDKKTLAELYTHQEQQLISTNRAEIWRAKREIKRLMLLKAKPGHSKEQKALIDADIKEYEDLIDCIQEAKELCY